MNETTRMQQITVFVYRSDGIDCTRNGITNQHGILTLIMDFNQEDLKELKNSKNADTILLLHKRFSFGKESWYCTPLLEGKGCGPMFGGNFVQTSDSRFSEDGWTPYNLGSPLKVHDRWEGK
jgi:hypothetical protein